MLRLLMGIVFVFAFLAWDIRANHGQYTYAIQRSLQHYVN